SALLGVALGIWFDLNITVMVLIVCCCLALVLNHLQNFLRLSLNTVLAIMAHTSLATGLVIISLVPNFRLDINSFLFGDLLAITQQDLVSTVFMVTFLLAFLMIYWRKLVSMAASEELASVDGIKTHA